MASVRIVFDDVSAYIFLPEDAANSDLYDAVSDKLKIERSMLQLFSDDLRIRDDQNFVELSTNVVADLTPEGKALYAELPMKNGKVQYIRGRELANAFLDFIDGMNTSEPDMGKLLTLLKLGLDPNEII